MNDLAEKKYKEFLEINEFKRTQQRHDYFTTGFNVARKVITDMACKAFCDVCEYHISCNRHSCAMVEQFKKKLEDKQ